MGHLLTKENNLLKFFTINCYIHLMIEMGNGAILRDVNMLNSSERNILNLKNSLCSSWMTAKEVLEIIANKDK